MISDVREFTASRQPLWVPRQVASNLLSHQSTGTPQLSRFIRIQIFAVIYLQKLAIPLPGIPPVSILLPIMLAGVGYMLIISQLRLSLVRATIFGLFVGAVSFSHILIDGQFSLPSLLLLLVLNGLLVLSWKVDWRFYKDMLSWYLKLMVPAAVLVLIQIGWCIATGHSLNLEHMIPKALLLPGYNYEAPLQYGTGFIRPNGFFMLEPSFISFMLGAAILTDATYFKHVWRLLLFSVALIGCTAATGIVMLAIAAPFLIVKQSPRVLVGIAVLCLTTLAISVPLGVADRLLSRVDELNPSIAANSSGGQRLVLPAQAMIKTIGDPQYLFTGLGAGQTSVSTLGDAWPMLKLAQEYGLVVMAIYMTLFLVSACQCPNLPLTVGLLALFHLSGGYLLNPPALELVAILCTICTPVRNPESDVR